MLLNFTSKPSLQKERDVAYRCQQFFLVYLYQHETREGAVLRCSYEKVFWKYAADLWETLIPKCDFTLRHGCSPVNLLIYCIFSEHLFLRTPLDGCFWINNQMAKRLFKLTWLNWTTSHCSWEASKVNMFKTNTWL